MINIHCRLSELSIESINNRKFNNTLNDNSNINNDNVFYFRKVRRNPGGGLYRVLDDVRPVLQVNYNSYSKVAIIYLILFIIII